MMIIDPINLDPQDSAHLITDIVIPRPIAWISTVDEHGVFNLAPFSAYGMISTKPMVVGFSVFTTRDGKKKDTIKNIESTKEFVVNIVTEDLAEAMNITSASYPNDVSEFEKAKLIPKKADIVKAPMVAESPVNMECRVLQILEFGEMPTIFKFVIGEVLRAHISDDFYDNQNGRVIGIRPIARMGGEQDLYCRSQDTFEMKRPTL